MNKQDEHINVKNTDLEFEKYCATIHPEDMRYCSIRGGCKLCREEWEKRGEPDDTF